MKLWLMCGVNKKLEKKTTKHIVVNIKPTIAPAVSTPTTQQQHSWSDKKVNKKLNI